jgi:hypothetical protein
LGPPRGIIRETQFPFTKKAAASSKISYELVKGLKGAREGGIFVLDGTIGTVCLAA